MIRIAQEQFGVGEKRDHSWRAVCVDVKGGGADHFFWGTWIGSPERIAPIAIPMLSTHEREGEFELGRIKGWIFEAGPSQAVFVSKQALLDPALKNVFERLAKGSQ